MSDKTRAAESGESTYRSVYPSKATGLITGDGEFILRFLQNTANVYRCPFDYEVAWERMMELGLIEYRRDFGGGFRPSHKGYQELERIFKAFRRGAIGRE
jgi:hypothetical protein